MKGLIIACALMLAACSSAKVSNVQPAAFKHAYGEGYIQSTSTTPAPVLQGSNFDAREEVWLDTTFEVLYVLLDLYAHGHFNLGSHPHHPHD